MSPQQTAVAAEDPLWYKDAIIYQLHVKSFFDANNDGIGDFQGLIEKLDYIAELGVTAIWMLPFYPSPRRDDGYDIADYRGVHEDYGTLADARRFIEAAHGRGIRVITELVINHTSDQHPWFQRARNAPAGSPERDFYVWSDDDKKYAGTRIIFLDTEKSNWTWDDTAKAYYWHRFYSHQPDLNFDNPAVLDEVLSVMRFWLDIGVDGLRLDAVPYLVEREGTNNENLEETHAILKRIRAELDRHAPGRMLLAEANQWPEDAQQYFGDGDECHMSFHFPLMPRMYMAIAREDRFPITDIMRQTPAIPPACQWAVFLRNHDELTLEMVTSAERDYLWETYASDRRARINLGIRRRLAPLLERDRRRVELMNGLLLSMPGTPVIYYGDEIAMGDNIHLGDRDGVRTPMQWSIDRNGGFSRADPAALVLPPIMDPVYGFQAVNVEAQAANPHSLLNWTRTMLAVRRQHRAFGRGTLRFLFPDNRKILAFLREFVQDGTEETLLCVSNLSRTAQAVELDLAEFHGRTPVDLVGGSVFPPIGQLTYLLTLPPYGFFWFILATEAALPSWHKPAPAPLPEYATLVVRRVLEEILLDNTRHVLEDEVLPAYLQIRRWFGSKGETLHSARIAYAVKLGREAGALLFTEIEARIGDRTEFYTLPMGICPDETHSGPLTQQLALTRIRRGANVGFLTDGFALDSFWCEMLAAMREERSIPFSAGRLVASGRLEFRKTRYLDEVVLDDSPGVHRLSAEQSNSSLIIDRKIVLKIVRKVLAGVHPEAEMTGYLSGLGFANVAPLLGEVVRFDDQGVPHTVVLAQGFIDNQGDAWAYTIDFLERIASEALSETDGGELKDLIGGYLPVATALGKRLAEMHAVLATDSENPDFAPAEADADVMARWAEDACEQIDLAVGALARVREWPSDTASEQARLFLDRADALKAHVRSLAEAAQGGAWETRVHGDFHLGQVLVTSGDIAIIDFEGEPAKTMAQRRAKSSPMRDVAGLLRSFDYAAATVSLNARVAASEAVTERRVALAESFRVCATQAFLDAYRGVLNASPRRWVGEAGEQELLDLFAIEKAAYEVRYEAANRPAWIGIPLAGIGRIAERTASGGERR
jgi:maltose alpha-D-glucosyltransferase/alpha-amylase